ALPIHRKGGTGYEGVSASSNTGASSLAPSRARSNLSHRRPDGPLGDRRHRVRGPCPLVVPDLRRSETPRGSRRWRPLTLRRVERICRVALSGATPVATTPFSSGCECYISCDLFPSAIRDPIHLQTRASRPRHCGSFAQKRRSRIIWG